MTSRRARHIIVDASVSRASGEFTNSKVASNCMASLIAIRTKRLHLVMTPKIAEEWSRQYSTYSRRWLVQMVSTKRVCRTEDVERPNIRRQIEKAKQGSAAMFKDVHLIEASLDCSAPIISTDERARKLFAAAADDNVGSVMWANPTINDEDVPAWIGSDCRVDASRKLSRLIS